MKRSVSTLLLFLTLAGTASSQWKDFGLWKPSAFVSHNGSLFAARTDKGIYRHGADPQSAWVEADTGINPAYFPVTAFASVGEYLLCDAGYRSSDFGHHWSPMNRLKFNPTCFATMGGLAFSGGVAGSGVWRSTDSGLNWNAAYDGLGNLNVNTLTVINGRLYAATATGVFRSTDSGRSWEATSISSGVAALCSLGSVVLAGTSGNAGILRSSDGGDTWTVTDSGLTNHYVSSLVSNGKYLFAGTGFFTSNGSVAGGSGVFVSKDSGLTWDTVNAGLIDPFGHPALSISSLCVFDTLLVAGIWQADGQLSYTYVRPISEMVPDTPARVVEQVPLALDSLLIYPNPSTGSFSLESSCPIQHVSVLNLLGQELQRVETFSTEARIDLSAYPSGTYFIQVQTKDRTLLRKIVRQ